VLSSVRSANFMCSMDVFVVGSLFLCVLCMFVLFGGFIFLAKIIFASILVMMLVSLGYSLYEVLLSVQALNLELNELETN